MRLFFHLQSLKMGAHWVPKDNLRICMQKKVLILFHTFYECMLKRVNDTDTFICAQWTEPALLPMQQISGCKDGPETLCHIRHPGIYSRPVLRSVKDLQLLVHLPMVVLVKYASPIWSEMHITQGPMIVNILQGIWHACMDQNHATCPVTMMCRKRKHGQVLNRSCLRRILSQ